ncbi:MAG: efflux RND transporter periplasmic adaptor subunit [Planctomycetaceae bacterium]
MRKMSENSQVPPTSPTFRVRWSPLAWRAGVVALLATSLGGYLFYHQHQQKPLKVSGFIEADEIRVGSRVGGRVRHVAVGEGVQVHKGDVLVELDPYDLYERRAEALSVVRQRQERLKKLQAGYRCEEIAQAKARYEQLQAYLTKLRNGPREQELAAARAQLNLANSNLELAILVHKRAETTAAKGAITQQDLDEAIRGLKVARAEVQVKKENLSLLKAGTRKEDLKQAEAQLREAYAAWQLKVNGYSTEEIAEAKAATDAAESTLKAIEKQIAELKILAPTDAVIESIELQPGDLVPANAPALSLVDTSHLWVRTYVPENQLNLKNGQEVDITVDSFPGVTFKGTITFIARQGEFTPRNVQTPHERSKQVFRIKVRVSDQRLRPGMAADVWLGKRSDAE